ncbi:MAG TPA: prepilin peptidase, partial [Syntrophales bacterium]|nr:prepilin peptidase [Syntrophales bacterium]
MSVLPGLFIALLGAVIGSFLNVCICRIPEGRSLVAPGSACPGCGHPIRPYDNIPVLSYLILKGRCR